MLAFSSVSPFYSVLDPRLWDDTSISVGLSTLNSLISETPSQLGLEVCLLGDFRSHKADNDH